MNNYDIDDESFDRQAQNADDLMNPNAANERNMLRILRLDMDDLKIKIIIQLKYCWQSHIELAYNLSRDTDIIQMALQELINENLIKREKDNKYSAIGD